MSESEKDHLPTPKATIFPPYPKLGPDAKFGDKVKNFTTWLQSTRVMRAMKQYGDHRGPMLAGGMAYMGLFSGFAGLWVFFTIAALVLANNKELLHVMIDGLGGAIPGLVGDNGVIKTETIENIDGSSALSVSGAIALISMLWTALNFLNGTRLSIRSIFNLPGATHRNLVLTKLADLGLLIAFVVGLLLSLAFTAASSGVVTWLIQDIAGLQVSGITDFIIRVGTTIVMLLFDSLVIAGILRVLSEIRIPVKVLWQGALIGGVLVGVLKFLGSALLGGASSNPLLVTFAALIGVLIFMNFMCQVLLISAAWVKVSMDDAGLAPRMLTAEEADEITRKTELLARRERLATERIRVQDEMESLPRWRRGKARRRYEQIIEEQQELEREALVQRMGLNPLKVHAERKALDKRDVEVQRDDSVDPQYREPRVDRHE